MANLPFPPDLDEAIQRAVHSNQPDHQLRVTWDGKSLELEHRDLPGMAPFSVQTVSVRHAGYRVKTTDRDVFDRARAEARAAGADEGLLLTKDGYVAEGTLFAIGWIDTGRVRLPSLDLDILPSVGRGRVIEVATALGLPVEEGRYQLADLQGRAVFATTATRGVVPIARLDGVAVQKDELVEQLAQGFWRLESTQGR